MAEVSISYENCTAVQFFSKAIWHKPRFHMRIVLQASMADVSITYENCSENILNLVGS